MASEGDDISEMSSADEERCIVRRLSAETGDPSVYPISRKVDGLVERDGWGYLCCLERKTGAARKKPWAKPQ